MGVVTNVVASFAAARKTFEQIEDQKSPDKYIADIFEVLVSIFYALHWDMENKTPDFTGLILVDIPYVTKYRASFPRPTSRPVICSTTLDKADKTVVQEKMRPTNKAKRGDYVPYNVAEEEALKLFTWAVSKTYLLALCKGPPMYMYGVTVTVRLSIYAGVIFTDLRG